MSKIPEYIKEAREELNHVIWPSRSQTINYTIIVIVLSIVLAYYLGIFDYVFGRLLEKVIAL